jgi:deazaflavin-dependent oxidoreductase (nitroreductase family)
MPSDLAMKTMNAVHRLILKVSGNRIGWSALNMPVLELTTIGRRSGQPRTVLLTSPLRIGEAYVVIASRGGDDHHPAWFLNLRDTPEVRVAVQGGVSHVMQARVAGTEERASLWPQVVALHSNYADYQLKTSREIPLVLLEPLPTHPDRGLDNQGP